MNRPSPRTSQIGVTLIELMISLTLGMVIVIAVTNVYLSNKQTFRSQEALAQIQQNARIGFELLSHDIREAGFNPCGVPPIQVKNGIVSPSTYWWANWAAGTIQGFNEDMNTGPVANGTAVSARVSTTDAIILRGTMPACSGQDLVITSHDNSKFTLASAPSCIAAGDVLLACDPKEGAIFQVTSKDNGAQTITHSTGGVTPGNTSATITHTFEGGGIVSKLSSVFWYIGNNDRGGRSLFRVQTGYVTTPTAKVADDIQEIAEGITDMQIVYLLKNGTALEDAYTAATTTTNWSLPVAVRITLTANSSDKASTNQTALERKFIHVISLRNREVVQ